MVDHNGTIQSAYDKLHLVPFGEYLPFQSALESLGLSQLTKLRGGFIPGTRRRPIALPNAPKMLPLICYEVIFPGDITKGEERPGWIVNVTNDGWFGISTGPFQHLQQARLRAVEEGLPIVRAANTGISAVIDPVGRVVARLGLGAEGVLEIRTPRLRDHRPSIRGMAICPSQCWSGWQLSPCSHGAEPDRDNKTQNRVAHVAAFGSAVQQLCPHCETRNPFDRVHQNCIVACSFFVAQSRVAMAGRT